MVHHHQNSTHHTFSLQRKLSALISCVIIIACTSLSWYFLQQHISSRVQGLQKQGILLAENLSRTGRYSVLSQDQVRLKQFIESTLQAKEIVYVIFLDKEGNILASETKGRLFDQASFSRTVSDPLFPSPNIAKSFTQTDTPTRLITPLYFSNGRQKVLSGNHGKAGTSPTTFFIHNAETVFDVAVPIFRHTPTAKSHSMSPKVFLDDPDRAVPLSDAAPQFYGLVQIGLSDVYLQQEMRMIILQVFAITIGIIALGILVTILVASRITRPLNMLTRVAGKIMRGDLTAHLTSTTDDEIGELTNTFNRMTRFLQEKDRMTAKHLRELQTLSRSGALVSASIEISDVFSSVVYVLNTQLGFSRIVTGLYDVETQRLSHVFTKGFPEDLTRALHKPDLVISGDKYLVSGLLCQAHLSLNHHLPADTWHLEFPMLRTAMAIPVGSMRKAPRRESSAMVVFLAADKGPIQCEPFDLDLIRTLANYLSIAMDKIFTYQKLETLNLTLESRVLERTDELETANSKLKNLDQLKSTFVSIASHELRTPLTSIKMFVDNMVQGVGGPLNQGHSDYLTRIRANVDRLQRMITELLDISLIESGRMKLALAPLNIEDIADEAIESLRPEAQEKQVSIQLTSVDTIPLLEGDRDKIFQILANLLHNAVKFSAPGERVDLFIQAKNEEHIEICVEDRGCGIEHTEFDNIFLPFYQTSSTMPQPSGAGLGLALCRHLVDLHQGQVWVESHPGKGSCFHVVFPTAIAPPPYAEAYPGFR